MRKAMFDTKSTKSTKSTKAMLRGPFFVSFVLFV
jgi:hypothetical protein